MIRIDEITLKQIRSAVDPATKRRSKKLVSKYQGIDKSGIIRFETGSGTTPGVTWKQEVFLDDLGTALEIPDESFRLRDRISLALAGDVRVNCNCKAHLYWGWRYIMSQVDASTAPEEGRFPKIRNPELRGTVCKHLESVLRVLPFNASTIVRDVKKILPKAA